MNKEFEELLNDLSSDELNQLSINPFDSNKIKFDFGTLTLHELNLIETYLQIKKVLPDAYISGSLGLKIAGIDLDRECHDLDLGTLKPLSEIIEEGIFIFGDIITSFKRKNYNMGNVMFLEDQKYQISVDLWHDKEPGVILKTEKNNDCDFESVEIAPPFYIFSRKLLIAMLGEEGSPKQAQDIINYLTTKI